MGTVKINQHIPLTLKENPIQILLQHTIVKMIYKIVSLALLATIISINKNDAKTWKYCKKKGPCETEINDFCCERPENVWKNGKGKRLCCEFPEKNKHYTYFKPEPCYSECIKPKGVDIQQGQDKDCIKKCTRGLREPCAKNEDCHKWNKKMICLKKRKVVDTTNEDGKDGKNMTVSSYVHEIIPGQCHHGLPTIVELAKSTPKLSNLTYALEKAELVNTLNGEGPFTVFAPSDDAWPLGYDLLKTENVENLKKKLLNHVVGGKYDFTKLREGNPIDLPTKGGKKITVDKCHITVCIKSSGKEYEILTSDIEASNGIIHIIRKALKV